MISKKRSPRLSSSPPCPPARLNDWHGNPAVSTSCSGTSAVDTSVMSPLGRSPKLRSYVVAACGSISELKTQTPPRVRSPMWKPPIPANSSAKRKRAAASSRGAACAEEHAAVSAASPVKRMPEAHVMSPASRRRAIFSGSAPSPSWAWRSSARAPSGISATAIVPSSTRATLARLRQPRWSSSTMSVCTCRLGASSAPTATPFAELMSVCWLGLCGERLRKKVRAALPIWSRACARRDLSERAEGWHANFSGKPKLPTTRRLQKTTGAPCKNKPDVSLEEGDFC